MWTPSCYGKNTKGWGGGFSLFSPGWLKITCRYPHNISWMLRNAAGPTVSGANHKPELPSTPFPRLMHALSCERCFVFPQCFMWGECYFPSMMQNLDYDLQVLCTVGLLTHQLLKSVVASLEVSCGIPHRTRGRGQQRIQKGWLGRPYGSTQKPAMPWSQGRGRPGHVLWATAWSPELGRSMEPELSRSCLSPRALRRVAMRCTPLQGQAQRTRPAIKTLWRTVERLCPEWALVLCLAADVSPWAAFTARTEKKSIRWWLFWPLHPFYKRQSPATITAPGISSSFFYPHFI